MQLSSNNFDKNQPSEGSTPIPANPQKSTNSFGEPSISSGSGFSLATTIQKSGSVLSNAAVTKDYHVVTGDDLNPSYYGGDFASFGDMYGDSWFTGFRHFGNRTPPPQINH